jgi:uncharacterized protein (DUF885 family)
MALIYADADNDPEVQARANALKEWRSTTLGAKLKSVIAAIGFLASLISPAFAQSGGPIQQDLAGVLKTLSEQLTRADQLVAQLRDTAKKGPVEAQLEVTKAGTALGQLADRLQDEGDIMSQLRAIKNAAQVHRDRVQALANGTITESDRTAVLTKWNALLQQADRAQAKVMTMRDKLLGALTELRERQVGISEELLVGSYEDAVKSLNQWLDELEKLMNDLRVSIGVSGV